MTNELIRARDSLGATLIARPALGELLVPCGRFEAWCWRRGELLWHEAFKNLVVTVGKNDLLTNYLKGSAYTASFFVGLKGTGTPLAADTMSSHSSWTEDQNYSEGARQALTLGSASAGAIDNSASKATFSINGSTTIFGAFVTTSSTKGGTTGTLFSAGDFGASRAVSSGDVLQVQWSLTI